jgi:GT2 family glycosyltransferase
MFSIIIPTWNNLDYLKLCVASINKHSAHAHEVLIHVNDGSDGTLDWVRAQGLTHTHARENVGVCLATNALGARATRDWLLYLNDDMVCCPGWDSALVKAAQAAPSNLAMFFSTSIEPAARRDASHIMVADFGRTPAQFDEAGLLASYMKDPRADILGRASQPTLVHRAWWNIVGGYSIEFSPGLSSDDDLMMKFYVAGCRHFRIVGDSRVYHFSEHSTKRVRKNRGGRQFVLKWGITQHEFRRDFIAPTADGKDAGLPAATALGRLKRASYGLCNYPLGDLAAFDAMPGRHFTKL